jgi:hypothetical protein
MLLNLSGDLLRFMFSSLKFEAVSGCSSLTTLLAVSNSLSFFSVYPTVLIHSWNEKAPNPEQTLCRGSPFLTVWFPWNLRLFRWNRFKKLVVQYVDDQRTTLRVWTYCVYVSIKLTLFSDGASFKKVDAHARGPLIRRSLTERVLYVIRIRMRTPMFSITRDWPRVRAHLYSCPLPAFSFFFGLQWEKVRWNDDREWWSQVQWFVPILESTIYQPLSNLVNQHNNKSVKQSKQLNFLLLIPRVFWLHVGATRMFDASETMERASSQTAGRRSTDR